MTNRRVAAIVVLVDDGVVVICGRTQRAARNKCIRLRMSEAVSQFIQDGAPEFRHSWNDVQLVRRVLNVAKKKVVRPYQISSPSQLSSLANSSVLCLKQVFPSESDCQIDLCWFTQIDMHCG